MPLSSSNVDRHIPKAFSASRNQERAVSKSFEIVFITFDGEASMRLHLLEQMHIRLADCQRLLTLLETHGQMTAVVTRDAGN
jgi:hypothetical protein